MNKLYYKSPILIQHLLTTIYGYKLKRKRYTKDYFKYFEMYKNNETSEEKELKKLLIHLKNNINVFRDINIKNSPIDVIKNLNFTYKDDLRKNLNEYSWKISNVVINKTGGTTGKSLKVYSTIEDQSKRMAYLDYIKYLHGVEPFSKRASFTGKDILPENHKNILWRRNYFMNQTLYASYKMNKDNVKYIFDDMKKLKPESIDGFPTSIHLLAKYILNNNLKVNWGVKAVFPTAEVLTKHMRDDIEKAFNTVCVDQYASSEGAPFLYSSDGEEFKIGHETGLFEFFKVDSNIYDMVVTSYINYGTVIVRYKIGDQVIINSDKNYINSAEDSFKVLKIIGRNSDYLVGNDENIVTSANMSNVYKDFGDQIIQSQFIQKDKNKFIINLVVTNDYKANKSKSEQILKEKLTHRLGLNNTYIFNYFEELPKEKSGKIRFIINEWRMNK